MDRAEKGNSNSTDVRTEVELTQHSTGSSLKVDFIQLRLDSLGCYWYWLWASRMYPEGEGGTESWFAEVEINRNSSRMNQCGDNKLLLEDHLKPLVTTVTGSQKSPFTQYLAPFYWFQSDCCPITELHID